MTDDLKEQLRARKVINQYGEDYTHPLYAEAADALDAKDAEIKRLRELADAALDYIDKSPCDPDITQEQAEAWERLRKMRHGGSDEDGEADEAGAIQGYHE